MNVLSFFFRKRSIPLTHEDIKGKTDPIIEGTDHSSQVVHDDKNRYTGHLIKLQKQTMIIKKEADKLSRAIDAAYFIAIATGAKKRGYE